MRNAHVVEAEGALAHGAEEVGVLVVQAAMVVAVAHLVAYCPTAILYGMDEPLLQEQGECAEDGTALGSHHLVVDFPEADGTHSVHQRLVDQDAHGGGLHPSARQAAGNIFAGHGLIFE